MYGLIATIFGVFVADFSVLLPVLALNYIKGTENPALPMEVRTAIVIGLILSFLLHVLVYKILQNNIQDFSFVNFGGFLYVATLALTFVGAVGLNLQFLIVAVVAHFLALIAATIGF